MREKIIWQHLTQRADSRRHRRDEDHGDRRPHQGDGGEVRRHRRGPRRAAAAGPAAAAVEEQTEFTVILKGGVPADKKIAIIKEVRALTGLGLKEAKDLVEAGDKAIKENISKDEAAKIKKQITDAGGTVEVK